MKLLFCRSCGDILKLEQLFIVRCRCTRSIGRYIVADGEGQVIIAGEHALIIAVDNEQLSKIARSYHFKSKPLDAFVLTSLHPKVTQTETNDMRFK